MGSISARPGKGSKATALMEKSAQKQTAREASRAGCGTYSRLRPQVKANGPKNRPNRAIRGEVRAASAPRETNGFPGGCPVIRAFGRGHMADDTLTTAGIGRHGATR